MGKIRVRTLGDEDLEKKQKKEIKKRAETKKVAKVEVVEKPESEEIKKQEASNVSKVSKGKEKQPTENRKPKTENRKVSRSKHYQTIAKLIDKNKIYSLKEGLELLPKLQRAKFDETVEMHLNFTETGISATLTLPHGTGKQIKVAIVDDALIKNIEMGKIDFDVLLAEPQMMPKLAKVARILGPKGLMPNPKNGTIAANPEEAAKKFKSGQLTVKSESKFPIMHLSVGKVSFGEKKLLENIKTVFSSLPKSKIKSAVLKSTMSPSIKLNLSDL